MVSGLINICMSSGRCYPLQRLVVSGLNVAVEAMCSEQRSPTAVTTRYRIRTYLGEQCGSTLREYSLDQPTVNPQPVGACGRTNLIASLGPGILAVQP